jgi:hypothetical protein
MPLERLPTAREVDEIVLSIYAVTGPTIHAGMPFAQLQEEREWDLEAGMAAWDYLNDEEGVTHCEVMGEISLTYAGIRRAEALLNGASGWKEKLQAAGIGLARTTGTIGLTELVKQLVDLVAKGH